MTYSNYRYSCSKKLVSFLFVLQFTCQSGLDEVEGRGNLEVFKWIAFPQTEPKPNTPKSCLKCLRQGPVKTTQTLSVQSKSMQEPDFDKQQDLKIGMTTR